MNDDDNNTRDVENFVKFSNSDKLDKQTNTIKHNNGRRNKQRKKEHKTHRDLHGLAEICFA